MVSTPKFFNFHAINVSMLVDSVKSRSDESFRVHIQITENEKKNAMRIKT